MSASITATVGSASANSYLTIAAADTIAATMLGTLAWTTATTDQKTRALITATRGLDTLDWIGYRATETQALDCPAPAPPAATSPTPTTRSPSQSNTAPSTSPTPSSPPPTSSKAPPAPVVRCSRHPQPRPLPPQARRGGSRVAHQRLRRLPVDRHPAVCAAPLGHRAGLPDHQHHSRRHRPHRRPRPQLTPHAANCGPAAAALPCQHDSGNAQNQTQTRLPSHAPRQRRAPPRGSPVPGARRPRQVVRPQVLPQVRRPPRRGHL
jgi:hypothetical protein